MERLVNEALDRWDDEETAWLSSEECAASYETFADDMDEADRRRRADRAIKRKSVNELVELGRYPATLEYVIRRLIDPTMGRPRRHGFEYLSDHQGRLALASRTVDAVREFWKREYGSRNRTKENGPSAEDIVVRRFERLGFPIDAGDLATWRRKFSGKSRR